MSATVIPSHARPAIRRQARAINGSGGVRVPTSTVTSQPHWLDQSWSQSPSAAHRSGRSWPAMSWTPNVDACHGSSQVRGATSISSSARWSTDASLASHSRTPGRSGSGMPSTAGISPSRSTSNDGRVDARAIADATTVVPLPPLAAQQSVTMTSPDQRVGCMGRVGAVRVPTWPMRDNVARAAAGVDRRVGSPTEVSGHLVGSAAFKAVGTGDPRPAGSIPVHLRQHVPVAGS